MAALLPKYSNEGQDFRSFATIFRFSPVTDRSSNRIRRAGRRRSILGRPPERGGREIEATRTKQWTRGIEAPAIWVGLPSTRKGRRGIESPERPERNRSDENEAMAETVQEEKLLRQGNALIGAHFRGQSLGQAIIAVGQPCDGGRGRGRVSRSTASDARAYGEEASDKKNREEAIGR